MTTKEIIMYRLEEIEKSVEDIKRIMLSDPYFNEECNEKIAAIESFVNKNNKAETENSLREIITSILANIGFKYNIKGFNYIVEGVLYLINVDEVYASNLSVTKELYPYIAKIYKTMPSRVERAIRHSIECVYLEGDMSRLGEIFPYHNREKGKVTNSEFLFGLTSHIRRKYRDIVA